MGGKTAQRVAGNVKPSSSGRIRELLINQQQGAGNIITFSALSNKASQPKPPAQPVSELNKPSNLKKSTPPPEDQQQLQQQQQSSSTTSPTKDANYKLVVKRVGDRDLYTRVRFSEGVEYSDGIKPSVKPPEVGVKKPAYLIDQPRDDVYDPSLDDHENEQRNDDKSSISDMGDSEITDDPEEDYDFDTLLDRLTQVQAQVEPSSSKSLVELNQNQIDHELEMLRLFRISVRKFNKDLSIEDWDLIIQTLYKWTGWISKSEQPLRESHQIQLCVQVFDFIYQLIIFAKTIRGENENFEEEFPMMQSLLEDWKNFHSSNLFQDILVLYFKLIAIDNSSDNKNHDNIRPIIESLAQIVVDVDPRLVLSHYSLSDSSVCEKRIELEPEVELPTNSIFCNVDEKKFKGFQAACGLLRSNFRVILVSAHSMLLKTMKSICGAVQVSDIISSDEKDVDDAPIFPPAPLVSILTTRDSIMSALLSDYRVGDISVTIEPDTDSYACTLSYLFAWDLAIQFIVEIGDKEVGHHMIHSFKRLGLIQRLLDTIFMLLPPLGERDSLNFKIESSEKDEHSKQDQPWCIRNFLKQPLATSVRRPTNEIELIALHLYYSVASHMPVTVRKWYNNNSNKRLCNLVNEYTVKHISQVICCQEMDSVQEKCQERAASGEESKNLIIKARPSAKEVYAMYIRDEFKMELTIKLPLNYPLGSVQIDAGKRVGVTDNKWRSWLLQLTTFLAHQNGPILDGIDLWRRNIDKRFEGIEKCVICYSILHSNYQLPKKKCQTCANMFHNLCLYKWFESSGNSTCPLCRNAW